MLRNSARRDGRIHTNNLSCRPCLLIPLEAADDIDIASSVSAAASAGNVKSSLRSHFRHSHRADSTGWADDRARMQLPCHAAYSVLLKVSALARRFEAVDDECTK